MKQPAHILFEKHLKELGLYATKEVKFHDTRKWRFDFLLFKFSERVKGGALFGEPLQVAVEIEGAIWSRGRHTRGKGYENDMRKYNAATMLGYRILRFSTNQVLRGEARDFIKEHLCK